VWLGYHTSNQARKNSRYCETHVYRNERSKVGGESSAL
jgi:hypothetical protein